jgi:hypothetical protein
VEEKRFKVIFSPSAQRDIQRHKAKNALQLVKDVKKYLETSLLLLERQGSRNSSVLPRLCIDSEVGTSESIIESFLKKL